MNARRVWVMATVAAAALGLAACGSDDDDGGGDGSPAPTQCTPPATATARFSTGVHPILTAKCGTCHGSSFGSADRAASYAAAQTRVSLTDPAQSALVVRGNGGGAHPAGDQLDDAQTTTITTWVRECAQNN